MGASGGVMEDVVGMGVDRGSYAGGKGEENVLDSGGGVVASAGGEAVVVPFLGDEWGSRVGGGAAALGDGRLVCNTSGPGGYMGWG
jgi:hypothetical protein